MCCFLQGFRSAKPHFTLVTDTNSHDIKPVRADMV